MVGTASVRILLGHGLHSVNLIHTLGLEGKGDRFNSEMPQYVHLMALR